MANSRLSTLSLLLVAALAGLAPVTPIGAQTRVVATTPTIADLVKQVGGSHVTVQSIMRGPENPHNVIPKPSYIMKLRRADLFVHTGLDAEPWVIPLLNGARQSRLLVGNEGHVNLSVGIELKQVPRRGQLDRAQGDIHLFGNPHYLIDPRNAAIAARTIEGALARADPDHSADFRRNAEAFDERMRELRAEVTAAMKPYRGVEVVTFHRAWVYMIDLFGLKKVGEIEPKPGITPFPAHLDACIKTMRARGTKIVIVETFNNYRSAGFVASKVEGKAVVLPLEVKGAKNVETYEQLVRHNAKTLIAAFDELGLGQPKPEKVQDRDR